MKKETKIIWSYSLEECEQLWQKYYMWNDWDVHKSLEVKWNWRKFKYMFTFTVIKK